MLGARPTGSPLRLYPFVWLPAKVITHSQYDVLYALQVGISILIGGYALGWLADKIGRRPALILSSLLAAVFIWPFAYVTNYPALFVLSIADTLGFAGYLAMNVVYMSEIMGPSWRRQVMLPCQAVCIFLVFVVVGGIIPHYWFPVHYRWFLWLLTGAESRGGGATCSSGCPSRRAGWRPGNAAPRRAGSWSGWRRGSARAAASPCPSPTCRRTRWWPRRRPTCSRRSARSTWSSPPSCWWSWCSATPASCTAARARFILYLIGKGGYSAGWIFAMTAWAGVVATALYILNAFIGDRLERRWTQLIGAVLFAVGYFVMYKGVHNSTAVYVGYILVSIGVVLWLWSMYVYIPQCYPTRMRALGTGWTDGVGHLGAWGGVLIAGALFSLTNPRPFFLFVTIPCALLPGVLIAIFGKNQRNRTLEELAH